MRTVLDWTTTPFLGRDITSVNAGENVGVQKELFEPGQVIANLCEADAVAAVVAGRAAEGDLAVRVSLLHEAGDLDDAVVFLVAADVEDLVVHRVAQRLHQENPTRGL